mgnify:CR=1 FL=1
MITIKSRFLAQFEYLAYKVLKVKDSYITKLNREPTINELANELEVEPSAVIEALLSTNSVSSLQEEVKNDDGNNLKMIIRLQMIKQLYQEQMKQ